MLCTLFFFPYLKKVKRVLFLKKWARKLDGKWKPIRWLDSDFVFLHKCNPIAITSFLLCPGHYWETECNLNDCCKNLPLYQMIARSCWFIHSYVFTYLSEFVCVLAEVCMCCSDSGLEHQRFPSLNQCGLGRTATAYLISFTAEVCQRLRPPNESWHTHTHWNPICFEWWERAVFLKVLHCPPVVWP